MKEAEYQKRIEDAQKVNEDLRRKLDQGSQQLQGEVQELELENLLRLKFPFDSIEPVPKGEFGGDVIQKVISQNGQLCGLILWESKRKKTGVMAGFPISAKINERSKPTFPYL
jgi:hypothetical protein